jgi:hypothetical protein
MAHLGSWKLSALLTFVCNTHDPGTGVAVDADSVPTYRIYEDETGTPLLTGSMALLDSAGTAGFYSEQVTLSAANGFEQGKSYNVYISATVTNSVTSLATTASMSHNFQMGSAADLTWILGTILTESAGLIAAAFSKFFNKSSPTGTINSIPDAVAGAAGGLSIVGSNMGSVTTVTDITTTAQAEPTSVPASNAPPLTKLAWLFLLGRNRITQTSNTQIVKANDGTTTVGTSAVSDDGVTAIRGVFS